MPERIRSDDPISVARRRLGRAETCVDLMRSILGGTTRSTPAHELALRWLKELERSRFCRLLELNALMRERERKAGDVPVLQSSESDDPGST